MIFLEAIPYMNTSNSENVELEAKLIEQEHRLFRVLLNVLFETKSLPSSDPRKIAARKALIWQLVPTGGQSTALIGTIIAVTTVMYTARQANTMIEQNALIQKQLYQQEQQRFADRRIQLITYLYDTEETANTSAKIIPKYNSRIRSEALVEFLILEKTKAENNTKALMSHKKSPNKVATLNYGVDLEGALLAGVRVKGADFRDTWLANADFSNSDVTFSNFSGASLDHADFTGANLEGSNLATKSLFGTNFYNSNLQSVTGWNDKIPIVLANIHGIKNAPPGFLEWANSHGAIDEPDIKKWKVLKNQRVHSVAP